MDRKIHTNELQRMSYVKKIAQAQIDKIEIMRDLSVYEVNFSDESDFSRQILNVKHKLDDIMKHEQSASRLKKIKKNAKISKRFSKQVQNSIYQLTHIMDGFDESFTLFSPKHTRNGILNIIIFIGTSHFKSHISDKTVKLKPKPTRNQMMSSFK